MVNINYLLYNCKKIINTYNFVITDKDNNVISDETYTNVTMPKRYFVANNDTISLRIGVMTAADKSRYMSNGKWKNGYAKRNATDGAGYTTNKYEDADVNSTIKVDVKVINPITQQEEVVTVDTGKKVWSFYPNIKEDDTSLFGTTAFSLLMDWECQSITKDTVILQGRKTIGFHNSESYLNEKVETTEKEQNDIFSSELNGANSIVLGRKDETEYGVQYNEDGTISGIMINNSKVQTIYGINFTDCGLFSGGTMLSHFSAHGIKRPTDYFTATVTVVFQGLSLPIIPFLPEGNLLYGHSFDSGSSTRTPLLRPTSYGFSSREYKNIQSPAGSGCGPIIARNSFGLNGFVVTDKPKDWDVDEDGNPQNNGEWFGFPFYAWLGSGEIYEKEKKEVEDGVDENGEKKYKEIEYIKKNRKEQRIINPNNLEEVPLLGFNSYHNIGPVRTVVASGFGVIDAKNVMNATGEVQGIYLGVADGVNTKYYHGIGNDVGVINSAYSVLGNSRQSAFKITYYDKSDNFFYSGLEGIYDNDFNLICPASNANKLLSHSEKDGYYAKGKYCNFGLNPFDLNYYAGFYNIITNWLVYRKGGTIRSGWVGGYNYSSGGGIGSHTSVTIRTASTIEGLKQGKSMVIDGDGGQHPSSVYDFQSEGYLAVSVGGLATQYPCYVGSFYYRDYDPAAIRISATDDVPGYIEFQKPPLAGSVIYADINFTIPFLYSFSSLTGTFYNTYGSEDMNGKQK